MSPIFVRPVREQLEHDRLIRFLQAKYKKKLDAATNVGEERVVPVKIGTGTYYPDLVLTTGKKLAGLVEVETGESVNNLEAMAQWVPFSRARVPFHLYVPVPGYDAARRLCEANSATPAEIWTYRGTHDGFDLVRIYHDPSATIARAETRPVAAARPRSPRKPARARPAKAPKRQPAKPRAASKPAARARAKSRARREGAGHRKKT